jgi:hypothetical protein
MIPGMLTIDDLIELNYLCEWMDSLPYKSFYPNQLPIKYFPKHRVGIDIILRWVSSEYRTKRRKAKLFWWCRGWGWRLFKGWRDKITELG